jgi:excisionase family DNA binding protein
MENAYKTRGDVGPVQPRKHPSAETARLDLMKIRIAAHFSQIHPDTIRRWIREGRIPAYGRRGTYRVNLKDLLPLVGSAEPEES